MNNKSIENAMNDKYKNIQQCLNSKCRLLQFPVSWLVFMAYVILLLALLGSEQSFAEHIKTDKQEVFREAIAVYARQANLLEEMDEAIILEELETVWIENPERDIVKKVERAVIRRYGVSNVIVQQMIEKNDLRIERVRKEVFLQELEKDIEEAKRRIRKRRTREGGKK